MSDNYQAIYDAVRSRIGGGNIGDVIRDVARQAFDFSHSEAMLRDQFMIVAYEMQRPSVLYRPTVVPDGPKWCAIYGPNPMEGVCGFGDTPAEAMEDFDKNWVKERTLVAIMKCPRCGELIEPGPAPDGYRDPDCPKNDSIEADRKLIGDISC